MRQDGLSDEDIMGHIRNGWHFYVKERGKYRHIIRRKGQLTRSHGAYDEENWERIQDLVEQWAKGLLEPMEDQTQEDVYDSKYHSRAYRRFMRLSEDIVKELRLYRGVHMFVYCRHKIDNYCSKWVWNEGFHLKKKLDDFYGFGIKQKKASSRKIVNNSGKEGIIFRASAIYCSNCSLYEPI